MLKNIHLGEVLLEKFLLELGISENRLDREIGRRAAVDQALSRLARSGKLMRICQGVYMRPIETRFGIRAPSVGRALEALSTLWGETIVPCGGSAANRLGLTNQNPVRMVYLTSGPSRRLLLGGIPLNYATLRAGNLRRRTARRAM